MREIDAADVLDRAAAIQLQELGDLLEKRAVVEEQAAHVLVVFVLYVIITDPAKAADYVQIGFEGVSNAAKAIGHFMTWLANGAK